MHWPNRAQRADIVIAESDGSIIPIVEAQAAEEKDAPLRACYRYIKNRPTQLDYLAAQTQSLPLVLVRWKTLIVM